MLPTDGKVQHDVQTSNTKCDTITQLGELRPKFSATHTSENSTLKSQNLTKFLSQRSGARSRRIEWCLTFEEWLAWWGDDIGRRGRGKNNLQMQRLGDTGPYALGNIVKGTPKENTATANKQKTKRYEDWVNAGNVVEPRNWPRIGDAVIDPDADYGSDEGEPESYQSMIIGRDGRVISSPAGLATNFPKF